MWIPVLFVIAFATYFLYLIRDTYQHNFSRLAPLTISEKKIILNNFPVYKKLSNQQKQKFEYRLLRFRRDKQFIFHGITPRQEDMALLLSATATILTLGFKRYKIPAIERLIIYPNQYFSKLNRRNHIGEYNPGLKTIVFSAAHVKQGFEIPNDNKNLGVHEFAHALSFNAILERNFENRNFRKQMDLLAAVYDSVLFQQKFEESSYFRAYSKANIQEFFAVAVENYVETPLEFRQEFPEIYLILRKMLNFDFHKPFEV
ncbi:zinc-dependent peptidase [Cellulophaga sp. L1A9]|uniref:zinc-dependent peptidase n=1 Tax=Cellulophaga sp. L1A9 TaxID=2686362 RepID=UPI00131CDE74|nr:zinc-dependent peptidase [Cellulophaga sp. L1A9]